MIRRFVFIPMVLLLCLTAAALAQGVQPQRIVFDDNWGSPGFNVVSQSTKSLEIVYSVPYIDFTALTVDGERFLDVQLPGALLGNNAGAPNLPGVSRYIAFPQGAAYSVEILESRSRVFNDMNILPAPPIQRENDDSPPVYVKDPAIYSLDAHYPAEQVMTSEAKKLRGVDVFILGVTPFAYNPVAQELVVYSDFRIRVTFTGGTGHIGDDSLRSRWFEPLLQQHLLNYTSLPAVNLNHKPAARGEECEYMIFVPDNPDYISWAKVIRDFRVKQGISTNIFNIADIGGTASAIEAKINDAYLNWGTKPVAVLMLGDLPMMPALRWNSYCLSDNMLADVDGDDLPEINIARMTARDAADLSLLINKFIDYETNPPTNPSFYDEPIMAGGWQTERWFILCTEVCYGYLANVQGKHPVREYAIYYGTPSVWSTNQNTYMIIDYFGPSGLGYIPLTPAHLTDWGANATRINNDINKGAFYMLHRDHGSNTGWGEPDYQISDLSGLSNQDLCFVMSINCLTGEYDYNPECFSEVFHRMQNGALGLLAASEVSYSFVNDTYIWGLHDSMWPDFDPGYGGSTGDHMLLPGFANASGKWYLQASSWPYNTSNKDETEHLFHMHGDAFMQLYSEVPQNLTVSHAGTIDNTATTFDVTADAGSLIALSLGDKVLGTATGTGAPVTITIDPPGNPGVMYVTVTKLNHYRYEGQVLVQTGGPLAIWLPEDPPSSVLPGPETDVDVMIMDGLQTYVPGSGKVHYRFDPSDPFVKADLTSLGGNLFNACIPGARPDSLPEFYVSADGDGGATVFSPPDAPATTYSYGLRGLPELMFYDGFETGGFAPYWTTYTSGAGRIQVTSANGPIGSYHVTMDSMTSGTYGNCTMAFSLDLSNVAEADLSFMFKEFGDETDPEDNVSISVDGVNWYNVMSLEGGSSYVKKTIELDKAAAQHGLPMSSSFRIRFSWRDNYPISTDGFAFDDIMVDFINLNPTVWTGTYELSAAVGESFPVYLDAGTAYAGRDYILGATVSGTYPGTKLPGGKVIPINRDFLTSKILNNPGSPMWQNFRGKLDSNGEAVATFDTLGPVATQYIGMTIHFAFTTAGTYDFVSNPVGVVIEP